MGLPDILLFYLVYKLFYLVNWLVARVCPAILLFYLVYKLFYLVNCLFNPVLPSIFPVSPGKVALLFWKLTFLPGKFPDLYTRGIALLKLLITCFSWFNDLFYPVIACFILLFAIDCLFRLLLWLITCFTRLILPVNCLFYPVK